MARSIAIRSSASISRKSTAPRNRRSSARLRQQLYEYCSKLAPQLPDTLEEMKPLFYAVYHGCQAGKHQEALVASFSAAFCAAMSFLIHKLGAHGYPFVAARQLLATPWSEPVTSLVGLRSVLGHGPAAFALRALGRLREAMSRISSAYARLSRKTGRRAFSLANLVELHLALGDIREAIDTRAWLASKPRTSAATIPQASPVARTSPHALTNPAIAARRLALFQEAEKMQADRDLRTPFLTLSAGLPILRPPSGARRI